LEERVQARLFDRSAEGYTLTPAGRALMGRAERMEAEALAIERDVAGADQRATGIVRVSTLEMIATRFIAPHLSAFAARCPDITLDLRCSNHNVSLARREADIALRLARPQEEDVVARKLASVAVGLYASHEYVAQHGRPSDPERSLAGHRVILLADERVSALRYAQRTCAARSLAGDPRGSAEKRTDPRSALLPGGATRGRLTFPTGRSAFGAFRVRGETVRRKPSRRGVRLEPKVQMKLVVTGSACLGYSSAILLLIAGSSRNALSVSCVRCVSMFGTRQRTSGLQNTGRGLLGPG
jgi:DNA-binding transcriptional LysR family regulator